MANAVRTATAPLAAAAILASTFVGATAARGHSLTGWVNEADDYADSDAITRCRDLAPIEIRSWSEDAKRGFALFDYPPSTVGISWSPHSSNVVECAAWSDQDRNALISSELIAFKDLNAGWDGPGSVAPAIAAVDEALMFLDIIPQYGADPEVMVAGDGEVGYYWKNEAGFIDISFRGSGEASFFARTSDGTIKGRFPVVGLKSLPTALARAIESVATA